MDRPSIGGQAVIEGVMMKAPHYISLAVRKSDGSIETQLQSYDPASKRNRFYSLPIIRGIVNFIEMMVIGVKTITSSAQLSGEEVQEPSKFEKFLAEKFSKTAEDVMIYFAVFLGIAFALGLFVLLPSFLSGLLRPLIASAFLLNLAEGGIRLLIFLGYIISISLMKDIKRVFMYHGAEHKVVNCFESGQEITLENARKASRLHARCGTNYLFLVVFISILMFSVLGFRGNYLLRVLSRLLLMPIVAGVAYEVLKLAAKSDGRIARAVRAPGIALQRLTTREPDESMIEVSMTAFLAALHAEEAWNEKPQTEGETILESDNP